MNTIAPKQNKFSTHSNPNCFHCGENCNGKIVLFSEKSFCCQGCKMVYEILNEKNLCQYYELEEQAGVSLRGKKSPQFAWLSDETIQTQLIDYQEDNLTKIHFLLPSIHCASCIWLLENLFKFNEAILDSKVNFLKKEIYLTFDNSKISLRQLAELLASIGYAPEINLGDLDKSQRKKIDKKIIYQLGVAGFAFGNIMLLSFPEYLGLDEINAIGFQKWFGYLNILLALPVLFFSGKDYLQSAWRSLRRWNLNIDVPISIGILTLFGRSIFEILSGIGAGYLDSLAGLIFFLLIGKWFQQITFNHLSFERDYKSYFPVAALLQNGETTPIQNLQAGDIIIIKNKELIPADGILLKGQGAIDYSFVTGESESITKKNGDQLFAGGKQIGTTLEIQITKTVSQSYLTQLWNDAIFSKKEKNIQNQTQYLADKIGKYFTYVILTIAFLTLAYWLTIDVGKAINAFTSVLIIACPCAVALSIPFTFGNAIRILGRNGLYLKNIKVIEQFQQITSVVFDKTGTLTSTKNNTITFFGKPLNELEKNSIALLVSQSSHPLSQQILTFIEREKPENSLMYNFQEFEGEGLQGVVYQRVIKIGSADFTQNKAQPDANVFLQIDGKNRGYFSIKSAYRKGFEQIVNFYNNKNTTHLLSGDNEKSRADLMPFFDKNLYYFQSPKDKLNFIKKLQSTGEKVLMLGDGLNDAGALQQSDVGVVIAENTNNFTPACDAILSADSFIQLPQFSKYMQGCLRLVYAAYGLAFLYNIVGLSYAIQAKLSPVIAAILMPASSVTIVFFGVLSGTFLAWKLGLTDKNHHSD
ncbi:MAG: heavy metal translocating P-type ATPase metal-binding domain-containing protein [Saprospiraceae bacterium]